MKAFAAIGIMLMHIRANGNYYIDGYLYNTVILSLTDFVFLFMVISAFGLCCGYFEKMASKNVDILGFYSRSFQKIFPFFALMVLIDILTSPSKDAVKEAFADLTLMFGFLPNPGSISVIGVGWFIGLIFVFYLCFPFFASCWFQNRGHGQHLLLAFCGTLLEVAIFRWGVVIFCTVDAFFWQVV